MEESQVIESEVQETEVQEGQIEETESPQTKQEAPRILETEIEIGDKRYKINENQLKQLYGIDPNEPLTQKEFKTMVSAYKSQKTADLKSNESAKYKSIDVAKIPPGSSIMIVCARGSYQPPVTREVDVVVEVTTRDCETVVRSRRGTRVDRITFSLDSIRPVASYTASANVVVDD